MANDRVAQWLLTWISTPEQASAIVGDLVEQGISGIRFWLAVSRVLLAPTWRWLLAVVLAGASLFVILFPYSRLVAPHRDFEHPQPWMMWAMYLLGAAACLGTSTGITASLYGVRDRLTWTCAAWWVLAMTACVFSAQPAHALGMIACVLAFAGGGMLLAGRTRGVFLCAIASAAAYGGTYLGLSRVMARVEVEILVHMMGLPGVSCCNDVHTFSAENVARVGLGLSIGVGVWLFSVFVATLVLTRLRRILLERSGTEVRLGDV